MNEKKYLKAIDWWKSNLKANSLEEAMMNIERKFLTSHNKEDLIRDCKRLKRKLKRTVRLLVNKAG